MVSGCYRRGDMKCLDSSTVSHTSLFRAGPGQLLASGGPQQWAWVRRRGLGAHKPISGQMMNKVFGGTVDRKSVREDGVFSISVDNTCTLFR